MSLHLVRKGSGPGDTVDVEEERAKGVVLRWREGLRLIISTSYPQLFYESNIQAAQELGQVQCQGARTYVIEGSEPRVDKQRNDDAYCPLTFPAKRASMMVDGEENYAGLVEAVSLISHL